MSYFLKLTTSANDIRDHDQPIDDPTNTTVNHSSSTRNHRRLDNHKLIFMVSFVDIKRRNLFKNVTIVRL